jgi:hypothetical protein
MYPSLTDEEVEYVIKKTLKHAVNDDKL